MNRRFFKLTFVLIHQLFCDLLVLWISVPSNHFFTVRYVSVKISLENLCRCQLSLIYIYIYTHDHYSFLIPQFSHCKGWLCIYWNFYNAYVDYGTLKIFKNPFWDLFITFILYWFRLCWELMVLLPVL